MYGGLQPRCRRKTGQLAVFPTKKKGFDGFVSFVTKRILWNTGKTEPAC